MALLDPRNTTLLVIDVQEKLLPAIWERERVVANVTKLLRLAQILGLKTVPTTQYCRGLGATVPEIAGLLDREPLDKTSFGCFGDPRITAELSGTLLVTGIETHICVCQTVLGALEAGPHGNDVMTDLLAPGVRRPPLPEAVDRLLEAGP